MSDKPRAWPNQAKEARDTSAEEAIAGIVALTPLVTEDRIFTEREQLMRVSRALKALNTIAFLLRDQGAQITLPK